MAKRVQDNHFSGLGRITRGQSDAGKDLATVINQIAAGRHTVTTAEDTAGTLDIVTGLASINSFVLTIKNVTTNILKMGDQVVTESAGTITVADGSTDKVVDGDLIDWIAYKDL